MPIYELPSETGVNLSSGANSILTYVSDQVPWFIPMFLFSLFIIIAGGGMFRQIRREGRADVPAWFAIGGYITTGTAYILFLTSGIINLTVVIISLAVSLLCSIWFFTSSDRQ